MSSFKNFAPMLSSLQDQADGKGTIAGSPLDDFLSIAGYETPGGGGGSSEFSTAEVTVTYTGNDVLTLYIPVYAEVPDLGVVMQGWGNFDEEEPTQTLLVVIPTEGFLIVGGNVPEFTSLNTQVTGNAEVTDGMIKITGDCTITISD